MNNAMRKKYSKKTWQGGEKLAILVRFNSDLTPLLVTRVICKISRCFRWRHNLRQSWWYRWRDHHHLVTPYIPQQTLIFPKTLHFTPRHYFGILRYTPENPLYPTGGYLTIDIPLYPKTPHPLTPKDIPLYLRKPTIPQDIQLYPKTHRYTLRHL